MVLNRTPTSFWGAALVAGLMGIAAPTWAAEPISLLELDLQDLAQMNVTSASLISEQISDAPSNIVVITRETIVQRGYQTLVEMAEDLPGFDFLVYEDGGGEYTTFSKNRGLGDVGNDKILIMVDGIVQNIVSYNWSTQWTFEALLQDLERVEVIQGPGSSLYGAQAFSGVINFITNKTRKGAEIRTAVGPNNMRSFDAFWGGSLASSGAFTAAVHTYESDGDDGNRYDPGGYWHDNLYPLRLLSDYDSEGTYVQDLANPLGGRPMLEGFNTGVSTLSARGNVRWGKTRAGVYSWRNRRGMASYITGTEYQARDPSHEGGHAGYHAYVSNQHAVGLRTSIESSLVYRTTRTLPITGFRYYYQFPDLTKSYRSRGQQAYVEERVKVGLTPAQNLVLGARYMWSEKRDRVVSLDDEQATYGSTTSSWELASGGLGLYQAEKVAAEQVWEQAVYGMWGARWNDAWSTSVGLRFDHSTEYGSVANPRLGVIWRPRQDGLTIKLLYGTAFRQPSTFELRSEFRGNENLVPEEIATYEVEMRALLGAAIIKTNVFYSTVTNFVGRVEDLSKPSLERFENLPGETLIRGASVETDYHLNLRTRLFANYMFTQGRTSGGGSWDTITQTARSKVNAGVNYLWPELNLNVNLRGNYVGPRRAQATNAWMLEHEGKDAPAYLKTNLTLTYEGLRQVKVQLIARNLFDTSYYGLARESGNSNIDDYDYATNPNPPGFIPAYHPQPGRNVLVRATFQF